MPKRDTIKIANDKTVRENAVVYFVDRDPHTSKNHLEVGRVQNWDGDLLILFIPGRSMGVKVQSERVFETQAEALSSRFFPQSNDVRLPREDIVKAIEDARYAAACDFINNDFEPTREQAMDFAKTQIEALAGLLERTYGIRVRNIGERADSEWRVIVEPYDAIERSGRDMGVSV